MGVVLNISKFQKRGRTNAYNNDWWRYGDMCILLFLFAIKSGKVFRDCEILYVGSKYGIENRIGAIARSSIKR